MSWLLLPKPGTEEFAQRYPQVCPHTITRPPMTMEWLELTMLHWRYPADEVQALLPDDLTVETFDGTAWVGLVPFRMRVDVPFLPTMASILHFPETNVRTYVYGRSGRPGVYFFSLEASSPLAVITARTTYQVPYYLADMSIRRSLTDDGSERYRYEATRRWPGVRGTRSVVDVEVGDELEPGPFDHFLTARWALYGDVGPWTTYATMHHEPWPLRSGRIIELDDALVAASGLSQPTGEPIVHHSAGVSVRCGWPRPDPPRRRRRLG